MGHSRCCDTNDDKSEDNNSNHNNNNNNIITTTTTIKTTAKEMYHDISKSTKSSIRLLHYIIRNATNSNKTTGNGDGNGSGSGSGSDSGYVSNSIKSKKQIVRKMRRGSNSFQSTASKLSIQLFQEAIRNTRRSVTGINDENSTSNNNRITSSK